MTFELDSITIFSAIKRIKPSLAVHRFIICADFSLEREKRGFFHTPVGRQKTSLELGLNFTPELEWHLLCGNCLPGVNYGYSEVNF